MEEAIRRPARCRSLIPATFTVGRRRPSPHAFALDTDGDFTPDAEEAVFDGAYHESYFQSAPYFALQIDGIEWLNSPPATKPLPPQPSGQQAVN